MSTAPEAFQKRTGSTDAKQTSSGVRADPSSGDLSRIVMLEPPNKAIADFYEGEDKKAVEDTTYGDLHKMYPMLCYCDPDGPIKPCRFRASGHRGRIPLWRKWLWAAPSFGWYSLKYMKVGYMKKFYTDDYPKASLGIIAFSSVLSVLVDAFTDPKMAGWTDNLRSTYGRRRPFVFASAIFVPFVFLFGWLPNIVSEGTAASIWFGVWHIMFKLADTFFLIPYAAWGAQLTPIYREKTNIWQWKELFTNFGILFGMAVAPLIFVTDACSSTPDDGCWELPFLSVGFGIIFSASSLLLVSYGREPSTAEGDQSLTVANPEEEEPLESKQDKPSKAPNQPATLIGNASPDIDPNSSNNNNNTTFAATSTATTATSSTTLSAAAATATALKYSDTDTIPMLISTWLNLPFRILLLTVIAKAVGQDIPFNVLPYMTAWYIGEKCWDSSTFFGVLVLLNLLGAVITIPIWTWFAAYTSKYTAYLWFNITLSLTTLAFLSIQYDDGSCTQSYVAIVVTALFGASYGGAFLLSDLVSDVVDYDELLTGGKRREASYLMAIEFLPKFMNIPGECVPFLMMAFYDYTRPLPSALRPSCSPTSVPDWASSADAYCSAMYLNTTGVNRCGDFTCPEIVANGVSFVCNDVLGECGIRQNVSVRWVLQLCFSVVPFLCIAISVVGLWFYPKPARSELMQEGLVAAITKIRRRERVDDPWRPGNKVNPGVPPSKYTGMLAYFFPSELCRCLDTSPSAATASISTPLDAPATLKPLFWRPVCWCILFAVMIPPGFVLCIVGAEDLQDDLGASVSPLGLMLIGIGIVGLWFNGLRAWVASVLLKMDVPHVMVVQQYNAYAPFIGKPPITFNEETEEESLAHM